MAIDLQCSCGKQYRVADDKCGKKVRCRHCQTVLAVPASAEDDHILSSADVAQLLAPPGTATNLDEEILSSADIATALPTADAARWYVVEQGQAEGPFAGQEIRDSLLGYRFSADTHAWREGEHDSRPLAHCPEFAATITERDTSIVFSDKKQRIFIRIASGVLLLCFINILMGNDSIKLKDLILPGLCVKMIIGNL